MFRLYSNPASERQAPCRELAPRELAILEELDAMARDAFAETPEEVAPETTAETAEGPSAADTACVPDAPVCGLPAVRPELLTGIVEWQRRHREWLPTTDLARAWREIDAHRAGPGKAKRAENVRMAYAEKILRAEGRPVRAYRRHADEAARKAADAERKRLARRNQTPEQRAAEAARKRASREAKAVASAVDLAERTLF